MIREGREEDLSAALLARAAPLDGQIHLTEVCNWKCLHCYRLDLLREGEMAGDEWIRILHEVAREGGLYLTISGGEPTLHRDFWPILEEASRLKFRINLFTNGSRIDAAAAKRLAALGLKEVSVSIHGATPETHDRVTEAPGSFEKAFAAVRFLRAEKIKTVVKMSLLSMNLADAAGLGEIVRPLGAVFAPDYTIIPRFAPPAGPRFDSAAGVSTQNHLAHRLTDEEIMRVERRYRDWTGRDRPGRKETDDDPAFCTMGWNRWAIDPAGRFYPCAQVPEAVGEVRATPFRKVWRHSARLNELRKRRGEPLEVCRSCDWNDVCKHRCMGHFFQESGEYADPAPERCRITMAAAQAAGTAGAKPRRLPPPIERLAAREAHENVA